jgi:hypothetical protein
VAKSSREYEPPLPGPLRLRDSVRTALLVLRHLTQVTLDSRAPPRRIPPAEVELSLVVDVEKALRCTFPDEILACLANGDDELIEYGFVLGDVVDHTRLARSRRCPKDLVAVGCHPDQHAFYCVSRDRPRDRPVQFVDYDNFDGSTNWYDLGEWLSDKAAGRQMFLAEQYPQLAGWKPSPAEVSGFAPTLTSDPA